MKKRRRRNGRADARLGGADIGEGRQRSGHRAAPARPFLYTGPKPKSRSRVTRKRSQCGVCHTPDASRDASMGPRIWTGVGFMSLQFSRAVFFAAMLL